MQKAEYSSKDKRFCKCGRCRIEIDTYNKYGKPRYYARGHNNFKDVIKITAYSFNCHKCKDKNFLVECACGCKRVITKFDKYVYPRRYIIGHYQRQYGRIDNCPKCQDTNYLVQCTCSICKEVITKRDSNGRLHKYKPGHQYWKGDSVQYRALHAWVNKYLPKSELCQICNVESPYDLANVTGVYTRDFKNWLYLCRKCHNIRDGKVGVTHPMYGRNQFNT